MEKDIKMGGNNILLMKYIPVMKRIVNYIWCRHSRSNAITKDDLFQEGLIILAECIRKHQRTRFGNRFKKYIENRVSWGVKTFLKKTNFSTCELSEDYCDVTDIEEIMGNELLLEDIEKILNSKNISKRDKKIFKQYIDKSKHVSEIAKQNNLSADGIYYIINRVRNYILKEVT